jgi:hypothetical protein
LIDAYLLKHPKTQIVAPLQQQRANRVRGRNSIERGDVAGARDLLANVDADPSGLVLFTLAETYDPNMLAAWGMRGVTPDIEKAKGLYGEAILLGYAAARQRPDSLK